MTKDFCISYFHDIPGNHDRLTQYKMCWMLKYSRKPIGISCSRHGQSCSSSRFPSAGHSELLIELEICFGRRTIARHDMHDDI